MDIWKKLQKKANLANEAKTFGVFAIAVVIIVAIVVGVRGTFTSGTAEYNASNSFVTAASSFSTWGTIIVLLMVGAYLLKKMGAIGGKGN